MFNCEFSINLSSLIVSFVSLVVSVISLFNVIMRIPKNLKSLTGGEAEKYYEKIKNDLTKDKLSVSEIYKGFKSKIFPNIIIENCDENSISDIRFTGSKQKITYYFEEGKERWKKVWYLK